MDIVIDKTPSKAEARIILLLDETGSMNDGKSVTLSKVNEYLAGLRDLTDQTLVSIYTFNSTTGVVCRLKNVNTNNRIRFAESGYRPDGLTPLLDAIGQVITEANADTRTLVVIMTDGLENHSSHFNLATVNALIKARERAGWTFIFLGAGLDSVTTAHAAASLNINASSTMAYGKSAEGQGLAMDALANSTVRFRDAVLRGQSYTSGFTDAEKLAGENTAPGAPQTGVGTSAASPTDQQSSNQGA